MIGSNESAMHLTSYQLNRYRHARLVPAELLILDEHLEQCDICRRQLCSQNELSAALASLQMNLQTVAAESHLSLTQCAAFINNELQAVERELFVSHLDDCAACATQFQAYRKSISEPKYTLGQALLLLLDSWRERLALVWPMPVAAAVVLALVALMDNVYWRLKMPLPRHEQPQQAIIIRPSESPAIPPPNSALAEKPKAEQPAPEQFADLTFPPGLAALRGESVRQAKPGTAASLQLTHPIATFVLSPRPTLRWQRLPNATSYSVKVFSTEADLVAESPLLHTTVWTVPRSLTRGKTYVWQVTARRPNAEIEVVASTAEAKFAVLNYARAQEIERAKRISTAPLALSIAYAQAGLLDDAEALLNAAPSSQAAERLRQQVRQARTK